MCDGTQRSGMMPLPKNHVPNRTGSGLPWAEAGPCLVSKLYTFAEGRTLSSHDAGALDALAATFAKSGNHVDQLMLDMVTNDAFRYVTPDL